VSVSSPFSVGTELERLPLEAVIPDEEIERLKCETSLERLAEAKRVSSGFGNVERLDLHPIAAAKRASLICACLHKD
jgi:hypothetical protein